MLTNAHIVSLFLVAHFAVWTMTFSSQCQARPSISPYFSPEADKPWLISSHEELTRVLARLRRPETHVEAFSLLLRFSGYPLAGMASGNLKLDELRQRAARALRNSPMRDVDLERLVSELERPESRMQAISQLIRLAGGQLYRSPGIMMSSGDREWDAYQQRAAKALYSSAGVETIRQALEYPDAFVKFWGIMNFQCLVDKQDEWSPLLPKLEELASGKDPSLRSVAIQKLQWYTAAQDFLSERIEVETSPEVLMRLLYVCDRSEYNRRFLQRFDPLLHHTDKKVRRDALGFIGSNSNMAPMWQISFDVGTFNRVIELTHSKSTRERSTAVYALEDIRQLDMDRSREAFIRLARDPSPEVRWRVAWGLKDQMDRHAVKPVIARLLNDPSPVVQYMTICAVGPTKHLRELKRLAHCPDRRIADMAANRLRHLTHGQRGR